MITVCDFVSPSARNLAWTPDILKDRSFVSFDISGNHFILGVLVVILVFDSTSRNTN